VNTGFERLELCNLICQLHDLEFERVVLLFYIFDILFLHISGALGRLSVLDLLNFKPILLCELRLRLIKGGVIDFGFSEDNIFANPLMFIGVLSEGVVVRGLNNFFHEK
jgi:hypothetical protein